MIGEYRMPLKLLIITPTLNIGGGEKLTVDLIRNIDRNLFDVTLLVLFSEKQTHFSEQVKSTDIKIVYGDKRRGFDFKIYPKINKILKEVKPDVIHTHLNVLQYMFPFYFTQKYKKVHTIHSVADKEAYGILKYVHKFSFKYLNVIPVSISKYITNSMREFYPFLNEIKCVYNGIDLEKFKPFSSKRNQRSIKFIATGSLYPVKNHKFMIEAFSRLVTKFENITLTILGDGELRQELEEQIDSKNLKGKVFLKGRVNNVAYELNKSDIYLMSSIYEGLPLSLLEAMACGLPIISTKAGGIVDVIIDGSNGLLVNNGDIEDYVNCMERLVVDDNLRNSISRNCQLQSQSYNIKKCVKEYEAIYIGEKKI
jgi:glycosyltransferase involved in cell wall biosynthesis